jgi:hypothetical protein
MSLYRVKPLSDGRWDDLVARHPRASVFHDRGWLEALSRTYRYEPIVLTSTPPGQPLQNGIVYCRVASWLTGTRLVSLPFSDHCDPLLTHPDELGEFMQHVSDESDEQHYRYVEFRRLLPVHDGASGFRESCSYHSHRIDIQPSLERIFEGLHRSSIQRKIQRADREGLTYEIGSSEQQMEEFYHLMLVTRRRHHRLPQPRLWFKNLIRYMGNRVQIRLARKNQKAIAAMLTLRNRTSIVYKYGCSDARFHPLGSMPFLFWKLIEEGKASGAEVVDLGRSDLSHEGLIVFKDRLGARREPLRYYRRPSHRARSVSVWGTNVIRNFFPVLPESILSAAGNALYKHMG